MIRHDLPSGTIWEGDWTQAPLKGGYTMAELDGPYGLSKAEWDKMGIDGLADWYAPHLARVTSLMLPSATVYLWNTAEGWARLDPVMRGLGWTSRALLTWNKGMGALAGRLDTEKIRCWPDVTEVCGVYQRDAWAIGTSAGQMIGEAAGKDDRNPTTTFIREEREAAGMTRKQMAAFFPSKTGGLTGCVTNWEEGYNFPTWEIFQRLAAACQQTAPPRERPYMVHPSVWPTGDLRASYDHLRTEYDHLRAEYEAARCFFRLPVGVTNVWDHPQVSGAERLTGPDGQALHPCQKPLLFAERMVQASTRPDDRVLVPFGGTCRIATYLERLRRMEPENARYHDSCELNSDGKDYLSAVLGRMGEDTGKAGQMSLFGAR